MRTLTIPAGALRSDATITISHGKDAPDLGDRGAAVYRLEPAGLQFNTPARLRMTYNQPLAFEEDGLMGYTRSDADGSWTPLRIAYHDKTTNQVEFELDHFSTAILQFAPPLDLVLHIPGIFLQKGDLIFALALSNINFYKYTWLPGHAGMYLGARSGDSTTNNGYTIIELTPGMPIGPQPGCSYPGGVGFGNLDEFRSSAGGHIYMGARRPAGLSAVDRTNIATFAISKVNKGYSPVGQGNLGDTCYSCVGLTEAAYDLAGKSIIPFLLELPFSIPLDQYMLTQPVGEITTRRAAAPPLFPPGVCTGACSKASTKRIPASRSAAAPAAQLCQWRAELDADDSQHRRSYRHFRCQFGHLLAPPDADHPRRWQRHRNPDRDRGRLVHRGRPGRRGLSPASRDGTTYNAVANASGVYNLPNLPAGTYTITAVQPGYVSISKEATVIDGQVTTSNIALPPPPIRATSSSP